MLEVSKPIFITYRVGSPGDFLIRKVWRDLHSSGSFLTSDGADLVPLGGSDHGDEHLGEGLALEVMKRK